MKKLPKFKSEDEERKFWAKHSPLDSFDPKKLQLTVFPNLKPSTRPYLYTITGIVSRGIKVLANKKVFPINPCLRFCWLKK